jgi:hypothetical protein
MSLSSERPRRAQRRRGLVVLVVGALGAAALVQSVYAHVVAAPTSTTPPTVTVVPTIGSTLIAKPGVWTGNPTFGYQWLRCPESGGKDDGSDCTATTAVLSTAFPVLVEKADVGSSFRTRITATNADGSATALSAATAAIESPPDQNVSGCPPVQEAGPLGLDEIKPPARLEIAGQTSTPAVITRSTQRITVRIRILACDGRTVRGALVYATPTPYQQFRGPERPTDANGWATITLTRQRFFPATPQQQNLIVFVRARNPAEDLLGGISARRLVSFRVRL